MGLPTIRWPSKPASNLKYLVTFSIQELRGWNPNSSEEEVSVSVTWRGPRAGRKTFTWKSSHVDCSSPQARGVWNEEFTRACVFLPPVKGKGPMVQPWDVQFTVKKTSGSEKEKPMVLGKADLDLAPYASTADGAPQRLELTLSAADAGLDGQCSLWVSLHMEDFRGESDAVINTFNTQQRTASLGLPEAPLQPVFMGPHVSLSSSALAGSKGSMTFMAKRPDNVLRTEDDIEDMAEQSRGKASFVPAERVLVRASTSSKLALSSFLSKSKSALKEPQGPWVDILDLSVHSAADENEMRFNQQPGEETEEEDVAGDTALYYGSIAGVNIAVDNDVAVPDLLPILRCRSEPSPCASLAQPAEESREDAPAETATAASSQGGSSLRFFKGLSLSRRSLSGRAPAAADAVVTQAGPDQDDDSDSDDMPEAKTNILLTLIPTTSSWFGSSKRKWDERSPRGNMEGEEPLLNQAYGEDGGDEIDWDRRQAEEASEHSLHLLKLSRKENSQSAEDLSASLFGEEDRFEVGQWSGKEIVSRDSRAMIKCDVFFASIDQCHEKASGAGACTALVVLLAEWLHAHPHSMPTISEFDSIIKKGSAEWRRLCEVQTHRAKFSDGHFDLETMLKAQGGGVELMHQQSFVGFFQLDALKTGGSWAAQMEGAAVCTSWAAAAAAGPAASMGYVSRMLDGMMTFDSIWEELEKAGEGVYILSWNDHFFVVCVEQDRCYVLDTLGERLFEGCNQAYILRFDSSSVISHLEPLPPPPPAAAVTGGAKAATTALASAKASTGLKGWLSSDPPAPVALPGPPQLIFEPLSSTESSSNDGSRRAAGLALVPGAFSAGPLPICGPGPKKAAGSKGTFVSKGVGKEAAAMPPRVVKDEVKVTETVSAMQLCGLFIKEFLAAVPLHELENDLERGRLSEKVLHRTLQVELNRTQIAQHNISARGLVP